MAGDTDIKDEAAHNSALSVSSEGMITMDYNKRYLVLVLEDQFVPGKELGLSLFRDIQMGTTICKDIDFPAYIRRYGRNNVAVLSVPAWDFIADDWLYSRMVILRGIENGLSMIRTARLED